MGATVRVWLKLWMRSTLCDRTIVDSIFSSNHTLCVNESSYSSSAIMILLKMNENSDKVEVGRRKRIKYYFLEDNIYTRWVSWIWAYFRVYLSMLTSISQLDFSEIVRLIPSLVHTTEKTNDTRRKRKRMAWEPEQKGFVFCETMLMSRFSYYFWHKFWSWRLQDIRYARMTETVINIFTSV